MSLYQVGLQDLPRVTKARTRSISAENPQGKKGAGAQEVPDQGNAAANMGKGWKVRPAITLPHNSKTVLADIEGPGVIRHIWITVDPVAYRNCILRMFWDGSSAPAVEVPLGDFFANGHALRCNIVSIPVAVNPNGGFNCYWPMPFKKHCKIEIESEWHQDIHGFFYQISYDLTEIPDDAAYFHAQWRRAVTDRSDPDHVILEGIKGQGHYVGTYLAWTQLANGWWGEGEIKFFIDGDKEDPTICGTGTEDYFGGAWCFGDTYSGPFLGYPLWRREPQEVPKHGLYRWHIMDPIRFEKDLKVTIQALGWWPNGKFQPLADDIASVGYWYQIPPAAAFPKMLPRDQRWPR